MRKKTRTILFLSLVVLFFLVAPSVILYSQGWRFDPKIKKVVKVGGLYFRVVPQRATIFVDGKEYKTDYFFSSRFIEGLLPGEYQVKIERQGFLPWKKRLKVEEERTTKAENVFLIPEKVGFEILVKNIEGLFLSEEKPEIVWISENGGWELKLLDLRQNLVAHLLEEKDIKEGAEFKDVVFSPKTREVLIKTEVKKENKNPSLRSGTLISSLRSENKYFLLNLGNASLTPIDYLNSLAKEISFSEDGKKLFFLSKDKLFEAELEEETPSPLLENVVSYQVKEGSIYYLDSSGFLFKVVLEGKRKENLSKQAFELKEERDYKIYIFPPFVFLSEEDTLFLLNQEGFFEKISEGFKGIKLSPDLKKLVFFNEHEIWAFFLREIQEQPYRKEGERLFLARFSEKINDVFWLTPSYLIFNAGEKIKICETDNRDKIQIWELEGIEAPEFFFSLENKKLYFLKEGNLFVTEKLIK